MTPARKRRLAGVLAIVIAAAAATALALAAFRENLHAFYSPSDVVDGLASSERRFQLGGIVVENSFQREPGSLRSEFTLTDHYANVRVSYEGILPDLFREGQSIIAIGRMVEGGFRADRVLAKHDETYMPAEVADALARAAQRNAERGLPAVDVEGHYPTRPSPGGY